MLLVDLAAHGLRVGHGEDVFFHLHQIGMLEMTGREYYISDAGGTKPDGHELIARANIGFTLRVYGQHAIGFQFLRTSRDSHSAGAADRKQSEDVASVVYTLLGDDNFGAVEWRSGHPASP